MPVQVLYLQRLQIQESGRRRKTTFRPWSVSRGAKAILRIKGNQVNFAT